MVTRPVQQEDRGKRKWRVPRWARGKQGRTERRGQSKQARPNSERSVPFAGAWLPRWWSDARGMLQLARPVIKSAKAGAPGAAETTVPASDGDGNSEAVIGSRLRAQLRAVWLLQRDLPVPEAVLVQARNAPSSNPDPYPIPIDPMSLEDQLVCALANGKTGPATEEEKPCFVKGPDGILRPTRDLPMYLASKKEKFMRDHMRRRQHVLENIPSANMPHLLADRIDRESKALKIYELQQKVRSNLLSSHVDVGIPPASQMTLYRKERPSLESSREEAERQWKLRKDDAEKRSKAEKHRSFLEEMAQTQKIFQSHHATVRRYLNPPLRLRCKLVLWAAACAPRLRVPFQPCGCVWCLTASTARRRNREILVKSIKQHFKNKERAKDKEKLDRLAALKANGITFRLKLCGKEVFSKQWAAEAWSLTCDSDVPCASHDSPACGVCFQTSTSTASMSKRPRTSVLWSSSRALTATW
eukprot:2668055-Rhodomonas_salina.1